jgi:antitoxin MazE
MHLFISIATGRQTEERMGERMLAKVQRWGNSLALRIPKALAVEAGISQESEVDLTVRDHQIIITPSRGEYTLAELCNQITPENMHGETDWGKPRGEETW